MTFRLCSRRRSGNRNVFAFGRDYRSEEEARDALPLINYARGINGATKCTHIAVFEGIYRARLIDLSAAVAA